MTQTARLGHSSTRAAMIYRHATRDRGKVTADALGALADDALAGLTCQEGHEPDAVDLTRQVVSRTRLVRTVVASGRSS